MTYPLWVPSNLEELTKELLATRWAPEKCELLDMPTHQRLGEPITRLGLCKSTLNTLTKDYPLNFIKELVRYPEEDLMAISNFGKQKLKDVKFCVAKHGIPWGGPIIRNSFDPYIAEMIIRHTSTCNYYIGKKNGSRGRRWS